VFEDDDQYAALEELGDSGLWRAPAFDLLARWSANVGSQPFHYGNGTPRDPSADLLSTARSLVPLLRARRERTCPRRGPEPARIYALVKATGDLAPLRDVAFSGGGYVVHVLDLPSRE
jgi:hypothetical protein